MVHSCCVPDCHNHTRRKNCENIGFHTFPSDPKIRDLWIATINLPINQSVNLSKDTRVCSEHFVESDYFPVINDPMYLLYHGKQSRRLKKGAVPSVFAWKQDTSTVTGFEEQKCDVLFGLKDAPMMEMIKPLQISRLNANMFQLLQEGSFTDVTLICSDGKVNCHKLILASVSPLLKSALKDNENDDATIILKSFECDFVFKVLQLLYSGEAYFKISEAPKVRDFFDLLVIDIGQVSNTVLRSILQLHDNMNKIAENGEFYSNGKTAENGAKEFYSEEQTDIVVTPDYLSEEIDENDFPEDFEEEETVMVNVEIKTPEKCDSIGFEDGLWSSLPNLLPSPEIGTDNKNSFKCTNCNVKFENAEKLAEHMCTPTIFNCDLCDKKFTAKRAFYKHKRYHFYRDNNSKSAFNCSMCIKTFQTLAECRRHQLVHSGTKPFSCRNCQKSFTRNENLQEHMKRYHAVENTTPPIEFQCETCFRTFKRKELLKKHLVVHMTTKPFTCRICNKGLSRKIYLDNHIQTVHLNNKKTMVTNPEEQVVTKVDPMLKIVPMDYEHENNDYSVYNNGKSAVETLSEFYQKFQNSIE